MLSKSISVGITWVEGGGLEFPHSISLDEDHFIEICFLVELFSRVWVDGAEVG